MIGSRLTTLLNRLQIENKETKTINQIKIERIENQYLEGSMMYKKQLKNLFSGLISGIIKQKEEGKQQSRTNSRGQQNTYLFDIKKFKNANEFRNWAKIINIEADIHHCNMKKIVTAQGKILELNQTQESIVHQFNREFIQFMNRNVVIQYMFKQVH